MVGLPGFGLGLDGTRCEFHVLRDEARDEEVGVVVTLVVAEAEWLTDFCCRLLQSTWRELAGKKVVIKALIN